MKRIIQTPNAPGAIGPYSQGVQISSPKELFYFSGQIAIDPKTNQFQNADIKEQTKLVLENIRGLLNAVSADFSNIVKTTIFLKSMNDFAAVNEIYGSYFKENPPARSTVAVAGLPKDALVEIEVIVAK